MRQRKHTNAFSLFSFQDIITSVTGILILLTLFLSLQLVRPKANTATATNVEPDRDLQQSVRQIDSQIKELQTNLASGQKFLSDFAGLSPTSLANEEDQLVSTLRSLQEEVPKIQADIARLESDREIAVASINSNSHQDELSQAQHEISDLQHQLASLKASKRIAYNAAPNVTKSAWLVDLSEHSIQIAKPGVKASLQEFTDGNSRSRIEGFLQWALSRQPESEYFVLLIRPKSLSTYRKVYEQLKAHSFEIGVDLLEQDAVLADVSEFGQVNP